MSATAEDPAHRRSARPATDGTIRTPEQQAIVEAARGVARRDTSRSDWQAYVDAGVVEAALPGDRGAGVGFVGLHDLLFEAGRGGGRSPLLEALVLAARPAVVDGPDGAADLVATAITRGDVVTGMLATDTSLTARDAARGVVLTGTTGPLPHLASAVAVVVRATTPNGPIAGVVPTDAVGVEVEPTTTLGRRADAVLHLQDTPLPPDRMIASDPATTRLHRAWHHAGVAAMQAGLCAGAIDLTAAYTSQREQFGRPIGSFQAVAQRVADAEIALRCLRLSALAAAAALDAGDRRTGEDVARTCAQAAWWAAEAGHQVAHAAQHLHGGHGMDLSYALPDHFRTITWLEYAMGGVDAVQDVLVELS